MNSLRAMSFGLMFAAAAVAGAQTPVAAPVRVAVIAVHTEIDLRTKALVERAIARSLDQNVGGLVVDLNTPGGRVDYMLAIADAIDSVRAKGVHSVAYISGDATSAGALIALACDEIIMRAGGTIGSATPYAPGVEMDDKIQEKMISYVRSKFRARAEVTGHPPVIAEAMVDPDVEVLDVEVDGKRQLVSTEEFRTLTNRLGAHRVVQFGVVCAKGKLLNLTADEARELGVASALFDRRDLALAHVWPEGCEAIEFAPTWSENLAAWITSPGVQMLLFLVGIVSLYIELKAPGLSVPGLIGVSCFALFFFGHLVVGLAEAWEAIVFLLGLILLGIEVFVIPGFGVTGVAGIVLMLVGLVLAQAPSVWPGGAYGGIDWGLIIDALGRTMLGITLGTVGAITLAWVLPHTPLERFITLEAPSVVAGQRGSAARGADPAWLGKVGVAETDLRPAGRVLIGDDHLDVVTEGDYLEAGTTVTVIASRGNALVVRRGSA